MANIEIVLLLVKIQLCTNLLGFRLPDILKEVVPHRDMYIFGDLEIDTLTHEGFAQRFLYSTFINATFLQELNSENNTLEFWQSVEPFHHSTEDLAIIIYMKTEESTLQVVEFVGNSSKQFDPRRIWTIVVWPTTLQSEDDLRSISTGEAFLRVVKNFKASSNLFFTFHINFSDSNGQGDNGTTSAIYETYMVGNHTVFRNLNDGVILWNCRDCKGPALRRFNFHQRNLKVTGVNDTEMTDDIYVYKSSNGTVSFSTEGFSGSMLEILKQLLNFTVEPMLSKDFGARIPSTNMWTGAIGQVVEGKADLGISISIFQPERANVVGFLPPADEHLINAFFKPPDLNSIRDIFAQPFKPTLWAAVVTTWIVLALCMILFSLIRKRYKMDVCNDADNEEPEPDFTKDSFMWALGAACQQGWDEHPRAGSLRTIFISGSFTGVVAYAGYSAAIVSTLSLRIDPIQNPLQLLKSNLHVGIRQGFISNLLEQNNTHDTMSKFYKRLEKSKEFERYLNVSAGLDRLLHHPYAFITTRDTIYDLLKFTKDDKLICSIKDLPILKYGFPLGYPVQKYSPFREILRYAMIMIREPGVLWRLRMKYSFKRRCQEASDNAGYALGPNDVFTAFMVLAVGVALSITFLIIERMLPLRYLSFNYIR